ncbi:type II toxin-antitoxin system antitoxin VapB [Merdimmobilis hominis]|uniref:type II toxin-antitoxin system antitoxin VapB n=1 Tax=Merdimmobilis hominis TaxID=2897707 RepID=UPI0008F95F8A|nr:type II toxin-antitoxin system VapB family antitoxin [Merdimmobilis hominis]
MDTAKIFENGKSQAVRLPKKFRFSGDEVYVQRIGQAVVLLPKEAAWQTFMDGLNSFTSDIFEDGRDQGVQKERESL